MQKIPTLFTRVHGKITRDYAVDIADLQNHCIATEKVDGTNVRVTIRHHRNLEAVQTAGVSAYACEKIKEYSVVRIEKRKNPNKEQKKLGILDPFYIDVDYNDKGDKYIIAAVTNTDFPDIPDGTYEAEAIGPKIQGNPYQLSQHQLYIFSVQSCVYEFSQVPLEYDDLADWLPQQKSHINPNCAIEGIVWTVKNREQLPCREFPYKAKIKLRDFTP